MDATIAQQTFFRGLARLAPGTEEATRRALAACDLPEAPRVADLASGTGASALILAEDLEAEVVALDMDDGFLKSLRDRAERREIDEWIITQKGDIASLSLPEEAFDLVWCEGGIYLVGWERALAHWGDLLKEDGHLVVSDCVWTVPAADRAPLATSFWETEYPEMTTKERRVAQAEAAGFEVLTTFDIGDEGWERYYAPLRQRLALVQNATPSEEMQALAKGVEREIAVWEAHKDAFAYVFFVLAR